MNQVEFELSPEAQQELRDAFQKVATAINELAECIIEAVKIVIEKIREIAINLARFFLKMQLLEWKIPYPLADFISRNIYWVWACQLGFNWFQRRYALKR